MRRERGPRHAARRAAALLMALAAVGCGAGERASEAAWRAATDTIGDTIVVRTLAGSEWGGEAELAEEIRIGVFEGEDVYMLGSVGALAVDADGFIYVFDRQVPALRQYGPDGRYVATFGRQGGGPGEYKNPDGGLAVLADGRIALRDPGNARITLYSQAGEPVGSWPIRGGFSTSAPLVADREGNAYTRILLDPRADVAEWRMGVVRYGPDGEPRDTIPAPAWDYEEARLEARREGGASINAVPFSARDHWAFSPLGYMVGGVSTRYAVDLFHPDGTVLRLARDVEPVPVGAGERADAEERATAIMRATLPDWRWNGPPIPDRKPPFREVFAGRDGRIWVQLSQPGEELPAEASDAGASPSTRIPPPRWREPVVFDVFEPDGRYLGQVGAPDGFSNWPTPVFDGDRVWAVVRDELEVQYVVRLRIERTGEGAG